MKQLVRYLLILLSFLLPPAALHAAERINVLLIIAAPGMKSSQITGSLVEFVDLYPTIVDFYGLASAHELAGKSLRTNDWRFTHWSDGKTELYHHTSDPEELHDVSSQHPEIVKKLTVTLQTIPKPRP
jgi:hypothetical protein